MSSSGWTVVRISGERGLPGIDGLQFLSCVAAVRDRIGDVRWHFRWISDSRRSSCDGLRLELPYGSPELGSFLKELETRVPPPDSVSAEPMRLEVDLDPIQNEDEADTCLTLLWRYSEFLADLRVRNQQLTLEQFHGLSPGAFLMFVTGDRRHLATALEEQSVGTVPVVPLSRVMDTLRTEPMPYRLPPRNRAEAVSAARIHHLAGCTFASEYYPFTRID